MRSKRDAAKNDIGRIVEAAGQSSPELTKEMIYFWERDFIENKEEEKSPSPKKPYYQKDALRNRGQALTEPLKSKIASESGSTMKTSGGSIYRKSDIAEAKIQLQPEPEN